MTLKQKIGWIVAYAIAIALLLWAVSYGADLVCDPNPAADRYRVLGLDTAHTIEPAQADGSVRYNLDSLSPGPYNGTIEAGAAYTLNGVEQQAVRYSNPVPFDLTVPLIPADSSGLAVKP